MVLKKDYDWRSKADYADYVEFKKKEVTAMHNEMKDFLKRVEELIEKDC